MTRLESRPARTGQWSTTSIDIEGHQQDPQVARALAELRDTGAVPEGLRQLSGCVL